jgi:hypothetical protein
MMTALRLLKPFFLSCIALPPILVIFVFVRTRIGPEEHPPCSACSEAGAEFPLVAVCDLAQNPERYVGILVRVEARFRHDSGQLFLEDAGCNVHAGFAPQWRSCKGEWRKLQICTGIGSWYDGSAAIRTIGSLSVLPADNYFEGERGFAIMCLEQVGEKATFGQRWRFALRRPHSRPTP